MKNRNVAFRASAIAGAGALLMLATVGPALAHDWGGDPTTPVTPQTYNIGVDHVDPANQQPQNGRVFEYTDFFSRDVSVHTGDTINFTVAPGTFHVVALAKDQEWANQVYPPGYADKDDAAAPNGGDKIVQGPGIFAVTGGSLHGGGTITTDPNAPPPCGFAAFSQAPCTFSGGSDVEINPLAGFGPTGPAASTLSVTINAKPGTYAIYCTIHPGMEATLNVVGNDDDTSTQAEIDAASAKQFAHDQAKALTAEQDANQVRFTGGDPGTRTYSVDVGISAANEHVAIDEMLPQHLDLTAGDKVRYVWKDPHNVHSVVFPVPAPGGNDPVPPQGFDCGTTFSATPCATPEPGETWENKGGIFDPGTSAPGTVLSSPSTFVDAGVLVGDDYNVDDSVQRWKVATAPGTTADGTYAFHCSIHDFMTGSLSVTG